MLRFPNSLAFAPAAIAVTACSGRGDTLAFTHQPLSTAAPLHSMQDCPTLDPSVTAVGLDGTVVITKVCVEDDRGNYYAIAFSDTSTAPLVVPAGPHYSVVYELGSAWVPDAAAAAAAAHAFVTAPLTCQPTSNGPGQAAGCPAAPEVGVPSTATLAGNLLTHSLAAAPAAHVQVFSELDFTALYAAYIASHPQPWIGGFAANFETGDASVE